MLTHVGMLNMLNDVCHEAQRLSMSLALTKLNMFTIYLFNTVTVAPWLSCQHVKHVGINTRLLFATMRSDSSIAMLDRTKHV